MLWVLFGSVSKRHFQIVPTTYVFMEKLENYYTILDRKVFSSAKLKSGGLFTGYKQ